MESTPTGLQFKLGFKVVKRENVVIDKDEVKLHCTVENHNKYYYMKVLPRQGFADKFTVATKYGRIGNTTTGTKNNHFNTLDEAKLYLQKKTQIQIKKGYRIVN